MSGGGDGGRDDLVEQLVQSYKTGSEAMQHVNAYEPPSMEMVAKIIELSRSLLFPGFVGRSLARVTDRELRDFVSERVDELNRTLRRQVYRGLHHSLERGGDQDCPTCSARSEEITRAFLAMLPALRQTIALDVEAAVKGDPAASGSDEIIFCYPGLYAITVYRLASALQRLGAKLIPRMMSELAHEKHGIDIHPGATIGQSFFIDHGTGVVIGETTVIGDRVRIYQGVTLGALSVNEHTDRTAKRHPTIEDDVVIYAGATILGGETVVGRGAVIGGNCWVISSVAPGQRVAVERRATPRTP